MFISHLSLYLSIHHSVHIYQFQPFYIISISIDVSLLICQSLKVFSVSLSLCLYLSVCLSLSLSLYIYIYICTYFWRAAYSYFELESFNIVEFKDKFYKCSRLFAIHMIINIKPILLQYEHFWWYIISKKQLLRMIHYRNRQHWHFRTKAQMTTSL